MNATRECVFHAVFFSTYEHLVPGFPRRRRVLTARGHRVRGKGVAGAAAWAGNLPLDCVKSGGRDSVWGTVGGTGGGERWVRWRRRERCCEEGERSASSRAPRRASRAEFHRERFEVHRLLGRDGFFPSDAGRGYRARRGSPPIVGMTVDSVRLHVEFPPSLNKHARTNTDDLSRTSPPTPRRPRRTPRTWTGSETGFW